MAKNNRHNAAFVVGSILGAVVGAGAALWKTPYTGQELREKLTGGAQGSSGSETVVARPADSAVSSTAPTRSGERSIKDKVLSTVEKTLAPIVGVELGKTANGNESSAKVVKDPNIKVNTDVSAGAGGDTSTSPDGSLGLSRDRVDADEWAAAYSGGASAQPAQDQPASTPAAATTSSDTGAAESGETLLRHPHRWRGYGEGDAAESSADSTKADGTIGLSQDRVDADKWAAAYSGGATAPEATSTGSTQSQSTQTEAPAASNTTSDYASTLIGQSRDQRNAARWASAYGNTSDSSSNQAQESAEQTGQGADPAFKGDDGDAERHPPVDRGMPENVAPATNDDNSTRDGREFAADAASTEQLTTPQVETVPDAVVEGSDRGMRPFPKLGGKE